VGKKPVKSKSLSALAAGLSARAGSIPARPAAPRDPLVAALARKLGPGGVAQKVSAALLTKRPVGGAANGAGRLLAGSGVGRPEPARVASPTARPAEVAPRPVPQSRPGPSSGVTPGAAGTSRPASAVASLVKTAEQSRAAPPKGAAKRTPQELTESRRQYPRVELHVNARLALADDPSHYFEASLPTQNLSVGGMFLASTFFLKLKTRLEVRLSLPPHGREVHVKGEVVRVDSTDGEHSGFALRFTDYLEGSEVVLATHFLSPVLREFIQGYAKGNGFKPTPEYLAHTADVLAAWELRRAQLGGDVWVVPGDRR
jgi:hypothetical protein